MFEGMLRSDFSTQADARGSEFWWWGGVSHGKAADLKTEVRATGFAFRIVAGCGDGALEL